MNQDTFLLKLQELHDVSMEITKRKNADYANNSDAFANFRGASLVGLTPAQGILVRMTDKLTRVGNLLTKEAQVKDESILDSLKDLSNYSLILALYLEHEKEPRGNR